MKTLFSNMSNLKTRYHFKLDFQKVDQYTGGKWLILSCFAWQYIDIGFDISRQISLRIRSEIWRMIIKHIYFASQKR